MQDTQESIRTVVVLKKEDDLKLMEFLYKRLIDYKDPNKREAIWDKF